MVFAIGNNNDGSAHILLLGETLGRQIDGCSDIGSLGLDKTRGYVLEKHLCRNIIGGDWQLHESIAGKDDESNLVVVKVVDQIFDKHLALVQTGWNHVLTEHGI